MSGIGVGLSLVPGLQWLGVVWAAATSKVGRLIIFGVVALGIGWHYAVKHEEAVKARQEIAAAEARIQQLQKKLTDTQKVAEDANAREKASTAQAADLKQRIDSYVAELAKRPKTVACGLSAADVRRLRSFHTTP